MAPAGLGRIPVDFAELRKNYPTYKKLPAHIQNYMDALNKDLPEGTPKNTPCCFQISEAFNLAGPETKIPDRSYRRPTAKLGSFRYLGAVDELEYYLTATFGAGEEIHKQKGAGTPAAQMKAMKAAMTGRQGVVLFRNGGAGVHVELWDGTDIIQNGAPASDGSGMNQGYLFGQPRVLFWQAVGDDGQDPLPEWLTGWWDVNDGQQYYYYISPEYVVSYTRKEPMTALSLPERNMVNEGTVTFKDQRLTFNWKPDGNEATEEVFTVPWGCPVRMEGTSNRFAPLVATRKSSWGTSKTAPKKK